MSVMNILMGQLVTSNAGRDQADVYLVVGIKENKYLLLVNGRERKLNNPKQKNIRHVNVLEAIALDVAEKLRSDMKITDEEVRQAIRVLHKPDNL